ncbi:hypothetical protein CLV92_110172 [Kineococcus xinjiangensis]|uniref:Uncharacterized protein n=1 Tax=Kineococcus xinjiangensis TaxID=512762 RepID=A0A2S6IH62_9ACTN|nr:hypothetical protein CLV92_110172 [Kineococcus xinjiangensis]
MSGQWFHEGCDDSSTAGAGCAGPLTTTQTPMEDVDLVLEQGASSWTLGVADAAGHAEDYAIGWRVRLPDEVMPGRAVLRAGGSKIDIQVEA